MLKLRVHVLGGLQVLVGADRSIAIPGKKAQALLAYLALHPGRPQSRDRVAFLLWEESAEVQARASLRQALTVLRKALCSIDGDPIVSSADTIALKADGVSNDAIEFERFADRGASDDLERAVELYTGDFLEGFNSKAPAFEDWLRAERQRLRERAVDAMSRLLAHDMASGATESAIGVALRLLNLDPLQESVHRALMKLYSRQGRGGSALRQFRICREILERELGERPEPDTERLYRDIQRNRRGRTQATSVEPQVHGLPNQPDDTDIALQAAPNAVVPHSLLREVTDAEGGAALPKPTVLLPDKPSIAVLPFDHMSRDPEQEYFSDGLAEDLITDLSQLSGLFVTSRHAAFRYKGRPASPQQVAIDLGVRYVLEGSARRAGERIRISAQLVEAATGFHLWAQRFDRKFEDIFDLQDEIAHTIVAALKVHLTPQERESIARRYTDNLEAYDLFLRARDSNLLRQGREDAARAVIALEQAIELDPDFAAAFALLAEVYRQQWIFEWSGREGILDHAVELARKAVRLDEQLPLGHMMLGYIHVWRKEHDLAIAEAQRSVELEPNNAEVWMRFGHILDFSGRPEEGLVLIEKGMLLDPHYPFIYPFWLGHAFMSLRRDEEAITAFQRAIDRNPNFMAAHEHAAAAFARLGRLDDAHKEAAEVLRLNPSFSIQREMEKLPYRDKILQERLQTGLRMAGLPE